MERREQDILDKVEEKTKDIQVPESLRPEQIEKLLEEKGKNNKSNRARLYRIGGLLAACLVLAAGIGITRNMGKNMTLGNTTENVAELAEESKQDTGGSSFPEDVSDAGSEEKTDDYKKVYSYIKAKLDMQTREESMFFDTAESGAVKDAMPSDMKKESVSEDMAMSATDTGGANASGGGYSETNVRQEGVDEGDIVKTDGRYLYVLKESGEQISIVDTKGALKEVGKIKAKKNRQIQEIYVMPEEKRLVCIAAVYEKQQLKKTAGDDAEEVYIWL